jgi:hypothetical protein
VIDGIIGDFVPVSLNALKVGNVLITGIDVAKYVGGD